MTKQQIVDAIKKQPHFITRVINNEIHISRKFGQKCIKVIDVILKPNGNGKYFLAHPNYVFNCSTSHFKSTQEDRRFTLNKTMLSSIIQSLKKASIWDYIENKHFLEVNDGNERSSKLRVTKELKELLQ